jgi:hypothetical protein
MLQDDICRAILLAIAYIAIYTFIWYGERWEHWIGGKLGRGKV